MNTSSVAARVLGSSSRMTLKSKSTNLIQQRNFMEVTKKQVEQIKNWLPTLAIFGATSFVGMCYFTDWRVTNEWIPFYSGKFKKED